MFFAGCAAVVLVLMIGMVLLCKSCLANKAVLAPGSITNSRIVGSYTLLNNACTYTFKEDGSGYLQQAGGNQYNFTFSLKIQH